MLIISLCACIAASDAEVLLKDFAIENVTTVPAESTFFLVKPGKLEDHKPPFYVAGGSKIFEVNPAGAAQLLYTLPDPVVQLGRTDHLPGNGLFACTAKNHAYCFSAMGQAVNLLQKPGTAITQAAFINLARYDGAPYAIGSEAGRNYIFRMSLTQAGPGKDGPPPQWVAPVKLSQFYKRITDFQAFETRGWAGLYALSDQGILWHVDPNGAAGMHMKSTKLRDAGAFTLDRFGLFQGAMIFSIPTRGTLWTLSRDRKLKCVARGLQTLSGKAAYPGKLAMHPNGTLYVLAGGRIVRICPKEGTDLAQSWNKTVAAEALYAQGEYKKAGEAALEALKPAKRTAAWRNRVQELVQACQGKIKLEQAATAAKTKGLPPLLPTARRLEKTFAATRLLPELSRFRKSCETAIDTIILGDFEEDSVPPKNFPEVIMSTTDNSAICLAAHPEPVREGDGSLRWTINSRQRNTAVLTFDSSELWGHSDEYTHISFWLYSPQSRVKMIMRVLNTLNVELARYYIVLKKGWQEFRRPPMYLHQQELPDVMTMKGFSLSVDTPLNATLYLDDIRLTTKKKNK